MEIDMHQAEGRLSKVEASIEKIKSDISDLKSDSAVIKNKLENIAVILGQLPCKEHFAEDRKLDEKIAAEKAEALVKLAEVKAESLLNTTALKEAHEERFVCIEKKQDRVITVWATVSGGIILLGTVLTIIVHFMGLIK